MRDISEFFIKDTDQEKVKVILSDYQCDLIKRLEEKKVIDNDGKVNFGDASAYNHAIQDAIDEVRKDVS